MVKDIFKFDNMRAYILTGIFVCIFNGSVCAANIQNPGTDVETQQKNREHLDFEKKVNWQKERFKRLDIDKLMDALDIRPGMTVLDIGTGPGLYAFKFAERLHGTGKVFATDIDKNMIDYVAQKVQKKNVSNVYPVLVKKDGIDPFYSTNSYDLILVIHTYVHISDQVSYFKKMKNFLSKDGRIVIMSTFLHEINFNSNDFDDFKGLIKELSRELPTSPFYRDLAENTRSMLKQYKKGEPAENLKSAIIVDLNKMKFSFKILEYYLEGKRFKNEVSFTAKEREYANWALGIFTENFFTKPMGKLYRKEIRIICKLNILLIVQRFRKFIRDGVNFLNRSEVFYYKQYSVSEKMLKAGYELEEVYDFFPLYEVALVFTDRKGAQ